MLIKRQEDMIKEEEPRGLIMTYRSTTTPLLGQTLKRCYRTTRMVLGGLQCGGLEPHLQPQPGRGGGLKAYLSQYAP